jgi:hypothetical protein
MYGPVDRDLGLSHPVRVRAPSARSRELAIAPGRRVQGIDDGGTVKTTQYVYDFTQGDKVDSAHGSSRSG